MDNPKVVKHVSLCAGYGGIDLGLRGAIKGLRTIAVSEIEAFAAANLVAKMEAGLMDSAPLWTDLKTFPWESFRDRVDILSGGYPCQPFSAAGKRLGKDDPRHLWPFIADGIVLMRPELCFFENVEGHISLGLRDVIEELDRIGYTTTWGIFSAAEVGAPHQRKRIFILAHRQSTRLEGYHDLLIGCDEPRRESSQPEGSVGGSDSSGTELAHTECYGSPEGRGVREGPDGAELVCKSKTRGSWPSRPGQPQYGWEPPRVVGNSNSQHRRASTERREHDPEAGSTGESVGNAHRSRSQEREGQGGPHVQRADSDDRAANSRPTQPPLGRDSHGSPSGLGYAKLSVACEDRNTELSVACDNRTDELRLLGNGVVPATCSLAFRTLLYEAYALQLSSGC